MYSWCFHDDFICVQIKEQNIHFYQSTRGLGLITLKKCPKFQHFNHLEGIFGVFEIDSKVHLGMIQKFPNEINRKQRLTRNVQLICINLAEMTESKSNYILDFIKHQTNLVFARKTMNGILREFVWNHKMIGSLKDMLSLEKLPDITIDILAAVETTIKWPEVDPTFEIQIVCLLDYSTLHYDNTVDYSGKPCRFCCFMFCIESFSSATTLEAGCFFGFRGMHIKNEFTLSENIKLLAYLRKLDVDLIISDELDYKHIKCLRSYKFIDYLTKVNTEEQIFIHDLDFGLISYWIQLRIERKLRSTTFFKMPMEKVTQFLTKCAYFAKFPKAFDRITPSIFLDCETIFGVESSFIDNTLLIEHNNKINSKMSSNFKISTFALTWNLGGKSDFEFITQALNNVKLENYEIIILCFQEVVELDAFNLSTLDLSRKRANLEKCIVSFLQETNKVYIPAIISHNYALSTFIYIENKISAAVSRISYHFCPLGFGGIASNKGCCLVRLSIMDDDIGIANCHLPAGEDSLYLRNRAFITLFDEILDGKPFSDYKNAIIAGDLNYRIERNADSIIQNLDKSDFSSLFKFDQLNAKSKEVLYLSKFREASIRFKPTYKYSKGSLSFDGNRAPSWTDRILTKGNVDMQEYSSLILPLSDHMPVIAKISLSVYKVK